MRALAALIMMASVGTSLDAAAAADDTFTGVFQGTGRACFGALYVRAKTIEWNSTYSICKPSQYEILENSVSDGNRRVVFHLKHRSRQCRYPVVEVEHASGYSWNVSGYQSLDHYRNKDLPGWNQSPLPERWVQSCLMTGPD